MELQKLFMERERLVSATNSAVNQLNASGLVTRADIEHIHNERGKILEMTTTIRASRFTHSQAIPILSLPIPNPARIAACNRRLKVVIVRNF